MKRMALALFWVGMAAALAPRASAGPDETPSITVRLSQPAPQWNAKFQTASGWIGGDCAYSTPLGRDRILWLFGDSLVGEVKDGGRKGAAFVNNTIAIQSGVGDDAAVHFSWGKPKDGKPMPMFLPQDGKGWVWPLDAVRIGDRLYIFLVQIDHSHDPGVFGFKQIGEWLAVVENPDDEPAQWRCKQIRMPFAQFTPGFDRLWGAALLVADGQCYIYGIAEKKGGFGRKQLIVARADAEHLQDLSAWRFYGPAGWEESPEASAPLVDGLANEFSVCPAPGHKGLMLICTENGLGDRIVARFADRPQGPWSKAALVYRCPEAADKGIFCYSAKAHFWSAKNDTLLLSYCNNTWDFGRLFRDEKVYRPRFVRVQFGAK